MGTKPAATNASAGSEAGSGEADQTPSVLPRPDFHFAGEV